MAITEYAIIDSKCATAGAAQFIAALASVRQGVTQTAANLNEISGASTLLRSAMAGLARAFTVKAIVDAGAGNGPHGRRVV